MPSSALRLGLVSAALIIALGACSKGSQTSSTTTTETATSMPIAGPSATAIATTAPLATVSAIVNSPAASPAGLATTAAVPAAPSPTAAGLSSVAFTDISGVDGADAIRQLAFLIGIDKTHFAPSRNLTREELVAILISRDNGGAAMPTSKPPAAWNYSPGGGSLPVDLADRDKISKPYWPAFQVNNGGGNSYAVDVLHRVYGTVKVFHPQQLATRADAAIGLQEIDRTSAANLVPKT